MNELFILSRRKMSDVFVGRKYLEKFRFIQNYAIPYMAYSSINKYLIKRVRGAIHTKIWCSLNGQINSANTHRQSSFPYVIHEPRRSAASRFTYTKSIESLKNNRGCSLIMAAKSHTHYDGIGRAPFAPFWTMCDLFAQQICLSRASL